MEQELKATKSKLHASEKAINILSSLESQGIIRMDENGEIFPNN